MSKGEENAGREWGGVWEQDGVQDGSGVGRKLRRAMSSEHAGSCIARCGSVRKLVGPSASEACTHALASTVPLDDDEGFIDL